MIYAPVIIPTLNRYDHLKQCLESLNRCHNADKTEVYISVDYPPSDKYWDGYKKVCAYLDNCKLCFKKLHVIKQKENLGVVDNGLKRNDNVSFLINMVLEKYDRWITTEDDNVFSPNFLDFINLGLEKYKNDESVYVICGYQFFYNLKFGSNNFVKMQSDNLWGVGSWKDRYEKMMTENVGYLKRKVFNPIDVYKVWRISNTRLADLIGLSYKKNFKKADNFIALYMIYEGMYQIMPSISKVRNIGWDGSGMHCHGFVEGTAERHLNQVIDDSPTFDEFIGTGFEYSKENMAIMRQEDYRQITLSSLIKGYCRRVLLFWK